MMFSINWVFFHNSPRCLDNFADYGRQFHEDDRDTRPSLKTKKSFLVHPIKWLP